MEAETLALAQEIDFSMWGLFARATITVKLVMLMLIAASVWSWGIIIQKIINYRKARAEAADFEAAFGLVSLWTGCSISWGRIRPGHRGASLLLAWRNGAAATAAMAG